MDRRSNHQVLRHLLRSFPSMPAPPLLFFTLLHASVVVSVLLCVAPCSACYMFVYLFVHCVLWGLKGFHTCLICPCKWKGEEGLTHQAVLMREKRVWSAWRLYALPPGKWHGLAITQNIGPLCDVRENIDRVLWALPQIGIVLHPCSLVCTAIC